MPDAGVSCASVSDHHHAEQTDADAASAVRVSQALSSDNGQVQPDQVKTAVGGAVQAHCPKSQEPAAQAGAVPAGPDPS